MIILYLDILDENFVDGDKYDANHKRVLENVRTVILYYQFNRLKDFLLDSSIGLFPAGSKIWIFCHLFKSNKFLITRLIGS